jgi:hypothetical protein
MTHGLTRGSRYRAGCHFKRKSDASLRLADSTARGRRLDMPTLHSDGRDHIGGGGGAPADPSPDTMITLADGTRITFTTATVSR